MVLNYVSGTMYLYLVSDLYLFPGQRIFIQYFCQLSTLCGLFVLIAKFPVNDDF